MPPRVDSQTHYNAPSSNSRTAHSRTPQTQSSGSDTLRRHQNQFQRTSVSSRSNTIAPLSMRRPTTENRSTTIPQIEDLQLVQAQRRLEVLQTRLMLLRMHGDTEGNNIPAGSNHQNIEIPPARRSMRSTCAAHPDCVPGNPGPIAHLDTTEIHIGCLASITVEQVMNENRLPTEILTPDSNSPVSWSKIRQAFNSVESSMQGTSREWPSYKSVARMLLSNRTMINKLKKDDPAGFIEFSLDTCDQLPLPRNEHRHRNDPRPAIPKKTLLSLTLDTALQNRIGFRFAEVVQNMLDISNEPDFVVNGSTIPRSTLTDWSRGRNLPRGMSIEDNRDAAAAPVMEIMRHGGSWGGHENSMDLTVGEYTANKFNKIISHYQPRQLSRSKIFEITRDELVKFNKAMTISKSRTQSARHNYTSDERNFLKQSTWSWQTQENRYRHVYRGLKRAEEENLVSNRFGNESQKTALHKLMSYILSKDHEKLQKLKLLERLCFTLEGIGKGTMNEFGYESHDHECFHGQVGAILSTPFKTDLLDLEEDTVPQINPGDLQNILMEDMKQHLNNEGSTVQVLMTINEDAEIPDEESPKAFFTVLREMFVENMLNKHCRFANTGISETQLKNTIDRIWPNELEPEDIVGMT